MTSSVAYGAERSRRLTPLKNRITEKSRHLQGDDGFSLSELAIYVAVFGVVLAVVASLVTMLFRAEGTVADLNQASNDAQTSVAALSSDIANARSFNTSLDGNVLVASVASGASGWQCVRWEVQGGELLRTVSPSEYGTPWGQGTPLARGVSHGQETAFFSGQSTSVTGTLQYSFSIATTGGGSQDVTGRVSNRAYQSGSSCA